MNWRESTLGAEVNLAYGKSLQASDREGGTIPVYGSNGIVGWHNEALLDGPGIVVGRKGSVGAINYSDKPYWPIDTTYYVVNKANHDWGFLHFLLLTLGLDKMNGHAVVPGLNRETAYSVPVTMPPLDEQRKIAAVLGKVQAAVAVEGDLVRVARELKQAALRQLFTRGLRHEPTRESRFGTVPAAWGEAVLSECAYVQTGIAKNSKNHRSDDIEIPYLRVANVQDGRLDLSEMKNIQVSAKDAEACLLQVGDVVLTEGGDFDKLGRGFIWEGQIERCVHQNHVFAVRTNRDRLEPRFFAYLAQSPYGKAYFLSVAHKTTNLACINTTKLRAFPVLLPPPAEQREIAALLATLDAKIAHHEARQVLLRELFRTLLHDLLTARRRVKSLDLSNFNLSPSPAL